MFKALVESVILYGAEVWGWYEEERVERVRRKYLKWVLGLDRGTPNYILEEETKGEELKVGALRRAFNYEEEMRVSSKKIPMECLREMEREKREEIKNRWEKRRADMREKLDVGTEGMRRIREETEGSTEKVIDKIGKRLRERGRRERKEKIEMSRYSTTYKEIVTEELPRYLRGTGKKRDRNLVAKFRCGKESKGGQYWREREDRVCRICEREEETIEHLIRGCEEEGEGGGVKDLLADAGEDLEEMKRIIKERERRRVERRGGGDNQGLVEDTKERVQRSQSNIV